MNPRSTHLGKQLIQELSHLSRLEFQHKCLEILQGLYPHLKMTSESGELDLSGIDLFSYDLNGQQIEFAFQCKGFESPEFDSGHLAQCLKSIRKFAATDLPVFSYRLIVNKFIKNDAPRRKIQQELEKLKAAGKAEYTELLDLNDFIRFIFDEVDIELRNSILKANQRFKEDYQRRMEQQFYQTQVPFLLLDDAEKEGNNPIQYLLDQAIFKYLPQRLTELEYSVRKKPAAPATQKQIWKFIISEFGFGKTSLLHNLFSQVKDVEILPLYIPIAQFDPESFVNRANAIRNMLEIILERKLDPADVFDRILVVALREMLKVRQDLVLLFDGLDEHYFAYRENGLRMLFDCFRDFQPICIFTLRKEFWSDRQGDFQQAVGKRATNKDLLFLIEWHHSHIIEYLEHWAEIFPSNLDQQKISDFKSLVERNEYERYYGDIPKRPLFLKMLIDDIIQDEIKQKNLAAIYENYLLKKFDIDRETSVSRSLSTRPLSLRGDRFLKLQQIFSILSLTASKMMYNDTEE
ncbi:hypothetical protein L0Z72_04430, partial [candidate division KSB1 bacterium]|nr:hypothetical protein [candidate division KSB1 bacterium]